MSGDLAAEPPLLPPQAQLTPLDLGLPAGATAWPEVNLLSSCGVRCSVFHISCALDSDRLN